MISMKFAIVFFACSVISCIMFTLGRWVGTSESRYYVNYKEKKSKNKFSKIENNIFREFDYRNYRDMSPVPPVLNEKNTGSVVNLDQYRRKSKQDEIDGMTRFVWMYSSKDNAYVKMPKEIADLISYLKTRAL